MQSRTLLLLLVLLVVSGVIFAADASPAREKQQGPESVEGKEEVATEQGNAAEDRSKRASSCSRVGGHCDKTVDCCGSRTYCSGGKCKKWGERERKMKESSSLIDQAARQRESTDDNEFE